MTLKVMKVGEIVGDDIVVTMKPIGELGVLLTNFEPTSATEQGPTWQLELIIGDGASARLVKIELAPFLSADEYSRSATEPLIIDRPLAITPMSSPLFLFRNRFFLAERAPKTATERDEVFLRIKRIVYSEEEELTALRSYVANIEAAIEYRRSGPKREPIPDDVKLLVWSRDGGACVRCQSTEKLHFDHVIPVAKGGGHHADNIQLLCQPCNLKKSDRISF